MQNIGQQVKVWWKGKTHVLFVDVGVKASTVPGTFFSFSLFPPFFFPLRPLQIVGNCAVVAVAFLKNTF